MRSILVGIGLTALLSCGNNAIADSPGQLAYEKDEVRSAVHQLTPAERVHERAAVEARARLSRIETRHDHGISLQRPTMYRPLISDPVVYVAPWGLYGAYPVPYACWLP